VTAIPLTQDESGTVRMEKPAHAFGNNRHDVVERPRPGQAPDYHSQRSSCVRLPGWTEWHGPVLSDLLHSVLSANSAKSLADEGSANFMKKRSSWIGIAIAQ